MKTACNYLLSYKINNSIRASLGHLMHSFICLFSRTGNDGLSFENCFYEQECYINIKCGIDDCRKFKAYKLVGEQIVAIASQTYKH